MCLKIGIDEQISEHRSAKKLDFINLEEKKNARNSSMMLKVHRSQSLLLPILVEL
ncbi:12786_t:CDS:2 [Dentiscutata erythropus]|uniref:12786_t:CDS:1 n=1 Tax=Dentiscutata erythropus TaxID=1348616 RepID=A0A9N8V693_9GLOM|nr:12786_t:CDS:2 [Dentiscutata erythropus]